MRSDIRVASAQRRAVPDQRVPAVQAGWAERAGAALRQHWPAVALLVAGLALRVLAEIAYRPALFYIDTARYLSNQALGMDPLGYKAPLVAIGTVAGFGAVAAVQHILGLSMAIALYALLLRRGAGRWLAALAIAPVLLDSYQIQIEQTLMPDVWFEALIVAGLATLAWHVVPGSRRVVAGGLVLGTSATVAQVGEALLLPVAVYLVAASSGWRQAAGRTAAFCAAFALPILAYCTGSYLITGNFFLSHTGVTSLYGRTAAAADCAALQLPAAEHGLCPSPAQQAKGPDWLEYFGPVQRYYRTLPRAETNRLVTDFSQRVLSQQPLRVVGAYGRDTVRLFAPTRAPAGSGGETPLSRWQFQTQYPYFPPWSSRRYVASQVGGAPSVSRPLAAFLRGYQLDGGYAPGPLLALFGLAGLVGSAAALSRRAQPAARQRELACLLFFAAAVGVLAVSDLFEFSWRYQLPALVTLAPAGALGLSVIAGWVRDRRTVLE